MHERRNIRLSAADRRELEAVVANRNSPQKQVWRAKIVLLTADGHGTAEIMKATGKSKTVIWRWQERFREQGSPTKPTQTLSPLPGLRIQTKSSPPSNEGTKC
jgi:hypothetical protein